MLDLGRLARAVHEKAIHERALVEAFPSSFMAFMLSDPSEMARGRSGKSDRFFLGLLAQGRMRRILAHFFPQAAFDAPATITHHDDRAAFVCALSAVAVAADNYAAVGDDDGWIVLPPPELIEPWALQRLHANAEEIDPGAFFTAWRIFDPF